MIWIENNYMMYHSSNKFVKRILSKNVMVKRYIKVVQYQDLSTKTIKNNQEIELLWMANNKNKKGKAEKVYINLDIGE